MNNKQWGNFSLDEIFSTIQRGKRLIKSNHILGDIPYVSSTMSNNGTDGFIGNKLGVRIFENCLTIANSGSVGSVFYHNYEFVASDHVTVLINTNLNKFHYIFLGTCLKKIKDKYSFNREISDKRIKTEKIILPIKDDGTPDWDYMERFIQVKSSQVKDTYRVPELHEVNDDRGLGDVEWEKFVIYSLGKVTSGKDWEAYNRVLGLSPFIGSASINNGITDFVDFSGREKQVEKGVIGINRNGSVGYAFYHPYKAYFSGDTRFLEINNFKGNEFINLFITTMIMKQKGKYAFGYKMGTGRIKRQKIMLPVKNGQPDFEFMEQYMKRMENKVVLKIVSEQG